MNTPICARHDAGLFDLDGVVYRGAAPVTHAADAISAARENGMSCVFVTNNASRTPQAVAEQLQSLDVHATPSDIFSSAHVGVELAEKLYPDGAKVLMCGGEGLRQAIIESSMTLVESADDEPDVVLHGFSPDTTWAMLSEAVLAINNGAQYIATNLDSVIPRERGLMLGMGGLAAAVTHATGVKPLSGAKPDAHMFNAAARKIASKRPLVIGDNLTTDIAGAYNSHIPALHVLTGVHTIRDILLAPHHARPRYLGDDLRCLNEPYPDVRFTCGRHTYIYKAHEYVIDSEHVHECVQDYNPHTPLTVTVGEHYAAYNGGTILIDGKTLGKTITLDQYRALVHTIWAILDTKPEMREIITQDIPDVKVVR